LSGRPDFSNEKLLESLRQCDGESVQVILSVRDDFWMSISRFMNELRVPLKDGENCNSIDLFDPEHARRVLHAFGYAYGRLPERIEELSSEQNEFLDQVIDGLTRDGRIVCVRLALLADMIKDRKWVFKTLTEIGGVEGVGVRFLEDRFGPHAPPRNQRHRKAAEKVLSALLPSDGDESLIKGGSR
ncbi:MAG: hypothetical protein KDA84_07895, partial [Planctomycetaceae bacterium]|nr:hypothetical protein [Planctomycetaceae bacterium]